LDRLEALDIQRPVAVGLQAIRKEYADAAMAAAGKHE
jgi:hypothetical protein